MTVYVHNGLAKATGAWSNPASKQGLRLLIVNLMPNRLVTELQFLKLLAQTKISCQVEFAYPDSHQFLHGDGHEVKKTYLPLSQAQTKSYDGLIVTGAPVEHLDFTQVDYWQDFQDLVTWAKQTKTYSLFECWASQAALKVTCGIEKTTRKRKLFGVYQAQINQNNLFVKGFGSGGLLRMPQSRHTNLDLPTQLPKDLQLLASSAEVEAFLLASSDLRTLFITGHPEYATTTLETEYKRDRKLGKDIEKPANYYQANQIVNQWQKTSIKLYTNWLKVITDFN